MSRSITKSFEATAKSFGQMLLATLVHTAGDLAIHAGNARRRLQQALTSWVLAYTFK